MSKIKNAGLDQYGAEPLEDQQFGTAGVEGVKASLLHNIFPRPIQTLNEKTKNKCGRMWSDAV